MTTAELDRLNIRSTTPTARAAGQATLVEQSRAVAEVQAAVVVAQQCPRNVQAAIDAMRESCRQPGLANRAFFRFSRGGSTVSGPSVHLARELARCWGNIQAGIAELRRDDDSRESEMLAFAWDIQTNARSSTTFIVPHARDTKQGRVTLTDVRDIYENNANHAARRLREMIFSILPPWFVEEAKDLCEETLRDGGGKPLAQRVADAIRAFDELGISLPQLQKRVGRARDEWTPHDIAELTVVYQGIRRGEVTRDDEFESDRVPPPRPPEQTPGAASEALRKLVADTTVEREARAELNVREVTPTRATGGATVTEVEGIPQPVPAANLPADLVGVSANPLQEDGKISRQSAETAPPAESGNVTRPQLSQISMLLGGRHGLNGPGSVAKRGLILSALVGRPLTTTQELTADEAGRVIAYLENTDTPALLAMADAPAPAAEREPDGPGSDPWDEPDRDAQTAEQ